MKSPYLLTAVIDRLGTGVTVTGDASTAVVELTVHGPWSAQLGERITTQLRACTAGPSAAIIIDLQHLVDTYGASMRFWLAAWRHGRLAPTPVQLMFCLPGTTALSGRFHNFQGPRPRVYANVHDAQIATAERVSRTDRLQAHLPAHPASVRAARDLVKRACRAWHPQLLPDTTLIMSELAANAVEHACTDFVATVTRSATGLHLAVRDSDSHFPQTADDPVFTGPQTPSLERGRGLRLIHAVADAWGAMPARGGKVVWATVSGAAETATVTGLHSPAEVSPG